LFDPSVSTELKLIRTFKEPTYHFYFYYNKIYFYGYNPALEEREISTWDPNAINNSSLNIETLQANVAAIWTNIAVSKTGTIASFRTTASTIVEIIRDGIIRHVTIPSGIWQNPVFMGEICYAFLSSASTTGCLRIDLQNPNYPIVNQLTLPVSLIWTNPKVIGSDIYAFASASNINILKIHDEVEFYNILTYRGQPLTQIGYDKMENQIGDRINISASNTLFSSLAKYTFASINARVTTTVNINLTTGGLLTIDGIVTVAGDIALVKNQTVLKDNGIYIVASGAWARHTDFAKENINCFDYKLILVTDGTINGGRVFTITEDFYSVGLIDISFYETPFSPRQIPGKIPIIEREENVNHIAN
jgi:hypothetical protein